MVEGSGPGICPWGKSVVGDFINLSINRNNSPMTTLSMLCGSLKGVFAWIASNRFMLEVFRRGRTEFHWPFLGLYMNPARVKMHPILPDELPRELRPLWLFWTQEANCTCALFQCNRAPASTSILGELRRQSHAHCKALTIVFFQSN